MAGLSIQGRGGWAAHSVSPPIRPRRGYVPVRGWSARLRPGPSRREHHGLGQRGRHFHRGSKSPRPNQDHPVQS
ncbi:hypothetical protein BX600DRAFT_460296 [Xylariales sp. PMI_506]|nr:hypothetical protein BX600DRAFT_460296 [Xylariales sp. PMI_506]